MIVVLRTSLSFVYVEIEFSFKIIKQFVGHFLRCPKISNMLWSENVGWMATLLWKL